MPLAERQVDRRGRGGYVRGLKEQPALNGGATRRRPWQKPGIGMFLRDVPVDGIGLPERGLAVEQRGDLSQRVQRQIRRRLTGTARHVERVRSELDSSLVERQRGARGVARVLAEMKIHAAMLTFAASERVVCVRLAEPTTILHISIHDVFVSNAGHLSPALLAELERLEPGGSARLWQRATGRALALALADQIGASVDARAVQTL